MTSVEDCAAAIRKAAQRGAGTEEILDEIVAGLAEDLRPITFITTLRLAFKVPVRILRDVENWDRLDERGDMSTAEVVSLLRFWIEHPS